MADGGGDCPGDGGAALPALCGLPRRTQDSENHRAPGCGAAPGGDGDAGGLLPAGRGLCRPEGLAADSGRRGGDGWAACLEAQHAAEHRGGHGGVHAAGAGRFRLINKMKETQAGGKSYDP